MVDHDDDSDEHNEHDHPAPAADPVLIALQLCQLAANPKTIATAIKKLRRLDAQYADIQAKAAAIEVQVEQRNAALAARAAELDRRAAVLEERETAFAVSIEAAHGHLRGYYNSIAEEDRRIRYRILSHANLLHGYNERLQSLPDWRQIKQMVPDLPADLPATPPAEVVSRETREDWTGHTFIAGSSLTRSVPS
jgi:hypothetical protein